MSRSTAFEEDLELHALPVVPQPAVLERSTSDKEPLSAISTGFSPLASPAATTAPYPPSTDQLNAASSPVDVQALPPVDRGKAAWIFLVSATIIELLIWMLPWGIGVLHNYWTSTLFKDHGPGAESTLTLAATLMSGLMYMFGAFMGPWVLNSSLRPKAEEDSMFQALPRYQMHIQLTGLILATTGLIGAAFATKATLYYPSSVLIFEWFVERRGLATGIMFAGSGAGGVAFPIIVSSLLERFSYRTTMLSIGVGFGLLAGLASLGIKKRVPITREIGPGPRGRAVANLNLAFFRRWSCLVGSMVILSTSMGFFVPTLWLPTYVDDLRPGRINGAAVVAIMNAASVPGTALLGYLSDHMAIRTVLVLSCATASLSCLLLWGLGSSLPILLVFAVLWGATGLSSVGMWSKIISAIAQDDIDAPPLIFSLFAVLKGVGSLTSGPISDSLLRIHSLTGSIGGFGYKTYGMLIVYTGAMTALGGGLSMMFRAKY